MLTSGTDPTASGEITEMRTSGTNPTASGNAKWNAHWRDSPHAPVAENEMHNGGTNPCSSGSEDDMLWQMDSGVKPEPAAMKLDLIFFLPFSFLTFENLSKRLICPSVMNLYNLSS